MLLKHFLVDWIIGGFGWSFGVFHMWIQKGKLLVLEILILIFDYTIRNIFNVKYVMKKVSRLDTCTNIHLNNVCLLYYSEVKYITGFQHIQEKVKNKIW